MAETAVPERVPQKKSKLPLLIGLGMTLALGAAGFYATWSGMILGGGHAAEAAAAHDPLPDIAFVPIDPVIVGMGPAGDNRHLRFTAQLEVATPQVAEVTLLMPRILDVLNSYLRAISATEIEDPAAMTRIRAQLLRRVQIVTGEGRVRDLLITEFILN